MIEIIPAGIDDAQLIAEVGAKSFYDAFGRSTTEEDIGLYLSQKFSIENIRTELSDPKAKFLLAYCNHAPAGYAKLINSTVPEQIKDTNAIEMQRIYVLKEYYRMKIGMELMISCLALAEDDGFDAMWLGVWQQNQRAIGFYKQWGFEIFGTRNFKLGNTLNDDYLMMKNLRQ